MTTVGTGWPSCIRVLSKALDTRTRRFDYNVADQNKSRSIRAVRECQDKVTSSTNSLTLILIP